MFRTGYHPFPTNGLGSCAIDFSRAGCYGRYRVVKSSSEPNQQPGGPSCFRDTPAFGSASWKQAGRVQTEDPDNSPSNPVTHFFFTSHKPLALAWPLVGMMMMMIRFTIRNHHPCRAYNIFRSSSSSLHPFLSFCCFNNHHHPRVRSTQTLARRSKLAPNSSSSDLITTHPIPNHLLLSSLAPPQGSISNWDNTLTAAATSLHLDDNLVEHILLHCFIIKQQQQQQPPPMMHEYDDAKKALSFFHRSSQIHNFTHGLLRSYCLLVHFLTRAGLLSDAHALLQSSILNHHLHASGGGGCGEEPSSRRLLVAETLLSTYELALPGPGVFDLLVQAYSKMRMVDLAFDACCYFGDHGFRMSLAGFNAMLHAAQKSGYTDLAWKVYEYMIERRVYPNQRTTEVMVDVMCKEGTLNKTIDVLVRIHGKNNSGPGVIVNSRLGLRIAQENRIERGIVSLIRLLQKNLILDDVMNSLAIHGHCKMGRLDLAYEFYDDMVKRGFNSNAFVHTSFIAAYCKDGMIEEAMQLMEEMVSVGLKPYDETYNVLIEGCSRSGRLDDSLNFYEKMLEKGFLPDCIACNTMMGKLCEASHVEKANEILTVLIDKGFAPNVDTYCKLMDGYGKIDKSQHILKLYYEMEHKGLILSSMVYASLVKNLCECGKLKEAEKFLNICEGKSLSPDGCVFDAMIIGCCRKGEIEWALYLFDEMTHKKLEPCAHTFMMLAKSMFEVHNTAECMERFKDIVSSAEIDDD